MDHNCCSCARDALEACGAKTAPKDFPADNQGIGLPEGYGYGWKKSIKDSIEAPGKCMDSCKDMGWFSKAMCQMGCSGGTMRP